MIGYICKAWSVLWCLNKDTRTIDWAKNVIIDLIDDLHVDGEYHDESSWKLVVFACEDYDEAFKIIGDYECYRLLADYIEEEYSHIYKVERNDYTNPSLVHLNCKLHKRSNK